MCSLTLPCQCLAVETVQEAAGEGTAGAGAGAGGHDRELGGPKEPAEGRAKQEVKKAQQRLNSPVAMAPFSSKYHRGKD
jgi:hypothetical protein